MTFLRVLNVHAVFLFAFLPAISVMLFVAFATGDKGDFVTYGLFALLANGAWVLSKQGRTFIADQISISK